MHKRILGVIITILLITSLVACSSKTPSAGTPGDKEKENVGGETNVTDEETDVAPADWRVPYEEPVQIVVAINEVTNATFAEGEDMTDNLWTRKWKEDFNIEVIVDWVSNEYETKLNLAIASNTLPDAFWCNQVQFNELAQAGHIQDLQGVYDKYASPGLKRMMENNKDILETAIFDGKLLGMPRLHYGYETLTPHLWARKDWVEEAGVTEVKSIEDLESLMDTFMSNNSAEFGIMLDRDLNTFYQMAPTFHSYPTIWVDGPDGEIVYGGILPETKDALAKWAEWYKKGYVRQDFSTLDSPAMLQDAYNGRVGIYAQQNWAGWNVGKDMVDNQGPDTYFIPFNLPTVDGEKIYYPVAFPNNVYNVVREGYEHPEVLIKLINSYINILDESVVEGTMTIDEVLPFNTNDMHHVTGPFKVEFDHYNDIKQVQEAVKTREEKFTTGNSYLFYKEIEKWLDNGDLTSLGRYIQMGYEKGSLVLALDHVDNDHILRSKIWGARPQAMLDYGSTLDDILKEGYTKIITGLEPVDYFDTLVEEWKTAGGDEVTKAVNDAYSN